MRHTRPSGGRRGDAGSATIWLVALLCLVGLAAAAALGVAGAIAARHRAESAADLAALAAAGRLLLDPGEACAEAAAIASAQGATLHSCAIRADAQEDSVVVEVSVPSPTGLIPGLPPARARARAGPVTAPF
ncbi:Rv3654c family TadE-like protein [Streptacidiphilus neutrinimicus]|uniref:Rv3654c family TadE-like protein n=1 Tax=Streptacidiphilus neutrinimicus TaxID=105420 RepID=UPI0005AB20CB|nr:Rv3654c family TadE-like protein [Streptacidiphilus neutrinimicus]